ncbi:MAG: nuclear transport factor 2 family protein [Planctomycetaceae bacterium]|nr:nuclear transport factor 2 family protein [Planctomycetaceae bacterium]MBV8309737.1 nuclear transport factor 2 family protein [Planctomycetaceae bacterium]
MNRTLNSSDARDWEAFRSLFADEITIDFGAVKPPQRTRADDLVAWARKAFSRMKTHHVGNHHMLDKRLEVVTDRSRAVAGREPRRELRFETKTSYNRGGGIHELGQGVRWRAAGQTEIQRRSRCHRPDSSARRRSCERRNRDSPARSDPLQHCARSSRSRRPRRATGWGGWAWRRLVTARRPPRNSTRPPLPTNGSSFFPGRRRSWTCCTRG